MLLGHSDGFREVTHIGVHLDSQFRFLGLDETILGFGEVTFIDEELRLTHQDGGDLRGLKLTSYGQGVMVVPQMFIHVDSFRGLTRLGEVFFSLLVATFILQITRVLHMYILQLVSCILVGHLEGFIEFASVGEVLNQGINEVHFE